MERVSPFLDLLTTALTLLRTEAGGSRADLLGGSMLELSPSTFGNETTDSSLLCLGSNLLESSVDRLGLLLANLFRLLLITLHPYG